MAQPARHCIVALLVCLLVPLALAPFAVAEGNERDEIDIPFSKFVLDNGLTLIVHEDHKAPIVAVNVWYHVGSKNEKPGRTGFAHLFEHLMFNGSENHNDDYFKPFDRIGATGMNGTTNFDRTNYFQNVPSNALDVALWMESDRMGHLLGAVDQARLDEQRGVVQNEKRQGENQPYGTAFRTIFEATYPCGHPYSWSVIGSMEDLDAASLEDVHEWFKSYYGAANAVLVVAGDVDTDDVRAKVEQYFGNIPAGPPVARHTKWIARRTGVQRQVLQDRVPQARIYKVWNAPPWGSHATTQLRLINDILTEGKNSRLYRKLVLEDQSATAVGGFVLEREIGSLFVLFVTAQPGEDLLLLERSIDGEIKKLLADGPTLIDVDRVRSLYLANFVRGTERIGGFGGKSDILARNEVFGGDPSTYKLELERVRSTRPNSLRSAAQEWLSDGEFVLEVRPFPEYGETASDVDRSRLPEPGAWPEVSFPARERATLSNGMELIVARRTAVPLVEVQLLIDAGFAADPPKLPGVASLTMELLDEGTRKRDTLQIDKELALLGARLSSSASPDTCGVRLSALRRKLDGALDLMADVVREPAFAEADFERLRREQITRVLREKNSPRSTAMRLLPRLLYGEGHPYGAPLTGSGDEESLERMTVEDVREFHRTWFDPRIATMIVVGDTTVDEIRPKIEERFGEWSVAKTKKKTKVRAPKQRDGGVYLVDRPGALQSTILAARLAPERGGDDELAIDAMNRVLGGSFTSRINMNLREDKHWSYGARSRIVDVSTVRPFYVRAPVQTDKTAAAMQEIRDELRGMAGERPPTAEELDRIKDKTTLSLPGRWETYDAVLDSIVEQVRFGLGEEYWNGYAESVRSLTLEEVSAAAASLTDPGSFVWVVIGDRSRIESEIRELGFGELRVIDADGLPAGD